MQSINLYVWVGVGGQRQDRMATKTTINGTFMWPCISFIKVTKTLTWMYRPESTRTPCLLQLIEHSHKLPCSKTTAKTLTQLGRQLTRSGVTGKSSASRHCDSKHLLKVTCENKTERSVMLWTEGVGKEVFSRVTAFLVTLSSGEWGLSGSDLASRLLITHEKKASVHHQL